MSWSKVKTLLIVLFIFVNVFLIYNLYFKNGFSSDVSASTVADTVTALSNNNVKIDSSLIGRKSVTLKKPEISNSIDSRGALAEKLLGKSKADGNVYENKDGKLTFNGVAFTYINYKKTETENISNGNAIDAAVDLLTEKGFELRSDMVCDFSSEEDYYKIKFIRKIEGYPLFESFLDVDMTKKGAIKSISGYWPDILKDSVADNRNAVLCTDQTKVLINLLSVEGFDTSRPNEIVDIQTGYTLGSSPDVDSPILLTLLPSYRIILKNGENYVFDATSGEFIYKY